MPDEPNYAALGFRCGLEIHQQVAASKLFCRCRTDLDAFEDDRPDFRFLRRLRPTQSELGEVDVAARAEAARARLFEYRGYDHVSCLVEADEEPPHPAAPEALDAALTVALLLDARPVDEIQWMRKTVIDGSNTSGFQRTGLVATGGRVDGVGLQTLCLEEDSCRRIGDEPDRVVWGLDRLGIPLIEIATEPSLRDGHHAREIAARLGALLRSTGRVKRGLGTIRQDLNVSIREGTRVEVKGVQELNAIPRVIDWEVRRQLRLVEVARSLRARGVGTAAFQWSPVDVSDVFRNTAAKFILKTLQAGGIVLGHRLPGLQGLLGAARTQDPRLGRELAAHARRDGGVQGLLHGDELPGLGVGEPEVRSLRDRLGCRAEDSFALVAERPPAAERSLRVVVDRAARAVDGVPPEVRMAEPDDTTSYLRPMPGSARMYPETDIPPNPVPADRLARLRASLPPPPEQQAARLLDRHGIAAEEARQIVADGLVTEFESLAAAGNGPLAARTVLAYLPDLERRHPDRKSRLVDWAVQTLAAVRQGRFAKEGIPIVLEALAEGAATVDEAATRRGLAGIERSDVQARARALVSERSDFVHARGAESIGPLMGVLMKEFRGRVDGRELNDILRREVERVLASPRA